MDRYIHELSSGSLQTRLQALQALQEALLRIEDGNGALESAIAAISRCWADFAATIVPPAEKDANVAGFSRRRGGGSSSTSSSSSSSPRGAAGAGGSGPSTFSPDEIECFYALLRCSNAVIDADPEGPEGGGYAIYFAKPSVLVPLRQALAQSPQDTELLFEAMKLLTAVADKFPLSFLRSRIAHDLITNAFVFTRLPIRSKHLLLGFVYSAASVIATREDSALLLMLLPTLKTLACIPAAKEIQAATGGGGGRARPAGGVLEADVLTSSRAATRRAADLSLEEDGSAPPPPPPPPPASQPQPAFPRLSETLQESFTRELALRVIIRTLLISVGLCDFEVDTTVSVSVSSQLPLSLAPRPSQLLLGPLDEGGGKKREKKKERGEEEEEAAWSSLSAAGKRRKEAVKSFERTITAKPDWPRRAVLFMVKKLQLVPFLTRALTAATTLSVLPSSSSPPPHAAATGSSASEGAEYGFVYGPVLQRLTTYGTRCIIRVLMRTYAFLRADLEAGAGASSSSSSSSSSPLPSPSSPAAAAAEPLEFSLCWPEKATKEIRAACVRLLSTAPLAHFPNSLEKEEALECCDDCSLFLLLLEREGRRTADRHDYDSDGDGGGGAGAGAAGMTKKT